MNINVQTFYDLKYLTMLLSVYMNTPTEPDSIALKHGMEYIIHHPHEPIMYSGKKIYKNHERSHQCYLKTGNVEINKNQEYPNFIHTHCNVDHAIYISYIRLVKSKVHLFNGNLIEWSAKK